MAYVRHFNSSWALNVIGDATISENNSDFGPGNATLKQEPRYEAQAHLRYHLSRATSLSVGNGNFGSARSRINGVDQNDRLGTRYARLSATHFVTPTMQLQLQYGQDVSVENGPEEEHRVNMRQVTIF